MRNLTVKNIAILSVVVGFLTLQSCNKDSAVSPTSATTSSTAAAVAGTSSGSTPTTNVDVTQANLLAAITTYLNTNYSGYTFVSAYSEAINGSITNYDVNITLNNIKYHVVFDAAGTFVRVDSGNGGKGKGSTPTTNVAVTQANLLAAISTYLNTNYSGYTFVNAYSEAVSGTITNYDVNITANSVAYHVVFDAAGAFVRVDTGNGNGGGKGKTPTTNVAVTQANLLAAISTYLTTNYSGYAFVSAYSEATNGTITNYDVNITLNSVAYHVVFDVTGTFVSVTKGK